MGRWMYRGVPVKVPLSADIPAPYRREGRLASIVQEILDDMKPWDRDGVSETVEGFDPMPAIVIPVEGRERIWAKHAGHRAKCVQHSPFVRVAGLIPTTTIFTIKMLGAPTSPMLVRAYPGDYTPPLPWQRIRREEDRPELLKFWRENAYVYGRLRVVAGSESDTPPDWFGVS